MVIVRLGVKCLKPTLSDVAGPEVGKLEVHIVWVICLARKYEDVLRSDVLVHSINIIKLSMIF